MGKVKTFVTLLKENPDVIGRAFMANFSLSPISHLIFDQFYLSIQYKAIFGKKLNLENPQTFNEKLQWLKLYDRNPDYVRLVDKYEVKSYIADKIGEEYIILTLGVWDRVEDIDFDALPNQFVLKCTHDSGSTIACMDKSIFDIQAAKEKLNKKLHLNLFWHGREWPYKAVHPRIIAERYIEDSKTRELRDYKFFCFNGTVKCFKIDFDRFIDHRANYFNKEGTLLPFGEVVCPNDQERTIDIPEQLDTMIMFAEKLSKDIPFLRVDFYEVNGKVYFGELTFFPASGFGPFVPPEWDETLGGWLKLPKKR